MWYSTTWFLTAVKHSIIAFHGFFNQPSAIEHSVITFFYFNCDNYNNHYFKICIFILLKKKKNASDCDNCLKGHLNAAFISPWLSENTDPNPGQGSME